MISHTDAGGRIQHKLETQLDSLQAHFIAQTRDTIVFKMILVKFVCAIITRSLFILVSLIGVWRVKTVKNDNMYWLLTVLYLPLVVEMIFTLRRRKGQDYKWWVTLSNIIIHGLQYCQTLIFPTAVDHFLLDGFTLDANNFCSIYLELNICVYVAFIWLL